MTEDEARQVELVRAVEAEDRGGGLLTQEDLAQAEARARAASSGLEGRRGSDVFIATRAAFASARLATRHPGIGKLVLRSRWPRWLGIALPLLSLAAGFIANELGNSKRLDVLAVPLLGTIAWNLLVYLTLLFGMFSRKRPNISNPVYRLIAWVGGIGHRHLDPGTPLQRAANMFEERWARASGPLAGARIARTLHLSAALFAGGLIAGVYLRALVIEYRAGWESTFLSPDAVHAILSAILGPASSGTGVAIPSTEQIAAMRWTGPASGGVNAAPWIHLYTATVAGLVVVPRLLLAFWQGSKALRLSRHFPAAGREDFYTRRLLRSAGSAPAIARVTPYAYQIGQESKRRLTDVLRGALGDGAEIRFDETVEYGAEETWVATHPGDPEVDYHVLLSTLSSTPEQENHGAFATSLAERIARGRSGTVLAAMIDESPFRAHFASQSGLEDRITGRGKAWQQVLSTAGLVPLSVDLSQPLDSDLAQRIESGLLPDGAMHR